MEGYIVKSGPIYLHYDPCPCAEGHFQGKHSGVPSNNLYLVSNIVPDAPFMPCTAHEHFYSSWTKVSPEEAMKYGVFQAKHTSSYYKLSYDGYCPQCGKPGELSGKVFEYHKVYPKDETVYFASCFKHDDYFIKAGAYKLVEDNGKKINPELTVSWPVTNPFKLEVPKLIEVPPVVNEKELSMYHLILRLDRQVYHYTTFARNESEAKEKIIKKFKYQFTADWIDQVNSLKANKVEDVVQVYEI
jgi:hypothetical protein